RTPLSRDVAPGDSLEVDIVVAGSLEPGRYRLRYDMVVEGVTWFDYQGSPCAHREIEITGIDSTEKFDTASRQVINRASDLDAALLLQVFQRRAAPANLRQYQTDVGSRDGVHILGILARFLALELRSWNGGLDSRHHSRQVSHDNAINRALHRAARCVSQHQH